MLCVNKISLLVIEHLHVYFDGLGPWRVPIRIDLENDLGHEA